MGRIRVILIVFILLLGVNGFSQELVYDVSIQSKPVGNMMVTKKVLDSGRVYYSAVMDLEYELFRLTEMVQLQEGIYQNDTLRQAYHVDKRNGEVIEEAKIEQLQGKKYYRTTIDTSKSWHEKPILKSMLKLYFDRPEKRDSVFSESTHQYYKIAKLPEENRFMMLKDQGEKSILEYNKNGICSQMDFNIGAVKYSVKLREGE